jgi:uncharacterized membrane protein
MIYLGTSVEIFCSALTEQKQSTLTKGGVTMDKFFAFLNKLFLIVAVIAIIIAVLDKLFGFVIVGLYPLSYLRFTGVCLLFVVAISLYQMAGAKAPKKAASKKKKKR